MKRIQHVLWGILGAGLFTGLNLLTTFTPALSTLSQAQEIAFEPGSSAFQKLAEADRLYLQGQIAAAEQLYREVKRPFPEHSGASEIREAIVDESQLTGAAKVYWREAQAGWEQDLETRLFVPLEKLAADYPEFIPGHVLLVKALLKYDRGDEAIAVMERATSLYPDNQALIEAEVEVLQAQEKWLEASIAARQFAVLNPDHPQAEEYKAIADESLGRYRSKIKRKLIGQTILSGVLSVGDLVLTGNASGTIPALQVTMMLLQGESSFGGQFAEAFRQQLPMVEDEQIVNYVDEVGQKMARLMGRDEFEYEFYVVDDDNLNAFALPGGKVFVNTGALMQTNSEAELAGLLGHEVAHAVLSHGYQRVVQGTLLSNLNRVVPMGDLIAALIGRAYSRQNERQADILGSRVLANSNYAADGLRNLMVIFSELDEERGRPPTWLSSHPASSDRVTYLEELIQKNRYNRYAYEGVERHAQIQARVRDVVGYEEE
jgi:predicted Zn-dependent protease